MAAIYDILKDIKRQTHNSDWREKMLHALPKAESVDRVAWLVERVKGRAILDLGCASGNGVTEKLWASAERAYGIDKQPPPQPTAVVYDLDRVNGRPLPFADIPVDVVVAGEVIEHLANPGWLLERIAKQWPAAEVIITVPNAMSTGGLKYIQQGVECVNRDHVAWYSWRTLLTLVTRYNYEVTNWAWYNGTPGLAEGLIFEIKQKATDNGTPEKESTQ